MRLVLACCLWASPALADTDALLDRLILPGVAGFAQAAQALDDAAADACQPATLSPSWNTTFDAWLEIAHLRIGPQEQAALTIAFWPDERGSGRRSLARMIAEQDPMGVHPDEIAGISAAARGIFALETLLFDPAFNRYDSDSYTCSLVATLAGDLARQARDLATDWTTFAEALRHPGAAGNAQFLSSAEVQRALFTQLHGGIEFIADQRLGRPLGDGRGRPLRAESWRSGRSLRNVTLSVQAVGRMAEALADAPVPRLQAAVATALYFSGSIADPGFQDVDTPQGHLRLESLQGRVRAINTVLTEEIGEAMGLAPGFNSLDGD